MEDNKVVNGTASFGGDVDPILPDGWKEGDDIFADGEESLEKLLADEQEDDSLSELENDDASPVSEAPTTGETDAGNVPDAGAQQPDGTPDGEKKPEGYASRKLTLRVNHQDEEVDIGAMSDDELRSLLQKGRAYDAMKDAENKRTYRSVYQEQIDAGMTEAVARMTAKEAAEGKSYALTDEEETAERGTPAATSPAPAAPTNADTGAQRRDLRAEVEQLRALYPEVKEFPDEVAKAVSTGIPVLTAYLAYREKQSAKTAASLQKENNILKQNAANSAKAPVRGVTGGDSSAPKKKSIFEEGFDAGFNWN